MHFRRSVIIAEFWGLKSQDVEKKSFLRFLEKSPVTGKFQNSVPKVFIATLIGVYCVQIS